MLEPHAISARDESFVHDPDDGPLFAGIALNANAGSHVTIPAAEACGIFIEGIGAP